MDLRVCECCPTTAAVTSEGPIAAFRNRTEDEVRDIHVSRLENGKWTEPRPVHEDGWKINACPVNGPMLSARGPSVALAWFTAKNDQGRAYVAFSQDAGRTFGAPIRIDDAGALGRVDVELTPDGSAIASWIEFAEQRAQFRVRRIDPSGARSPSVTVSNLTGGRASGYPRLESSGDELVVAWTADRPRRLAGADRGGPIACESAVKAATLLYHHSRPAPVRRPVPQPIRSGLLSQRHSLFAQRLYGGKIRST